jgi:hypothetical protein
VIIEWFPVLKDFAAKFRKFKPDFLFHALLSALVQASNAIIKTPTPTMLLYSYALTTRVLTGYLLSNFGVFTLEIVTA